MMIWCSEVDEKVFRNAWENTQDLALDSDIELVSIRGDLVYVIDCCLEH